MKRAAIVTGAGSGIGKAVAQGLSAQGFGVVLAGRHRASLRETGATLKGEWMEVEADIASEPDVLRLIDAALERFGRVDALVNNAALAPTAPIDRIELGSIEQAFRVNCAGPMLLVSRLWETLKSQGGGRIVNISSMATVDPFAGLAVYAASKGAMNTFTRAIANEGRRAGIMAFAVAPGAVETKMLRSIVDEKSLPKSKTLRPEDVARVVMECVKGDRDTENGGVILVPSP